jgi:hypothetical protein
MLSARMEEDMALQPESGAPTFYTFTAFRLGRTPLFYGGLLSVLTFCAVVFLFHYGLKEKLWSYETLQFGAISPSPADVITNSPSALGAAQQVVRAILPEAVLRSLAGTYFSPEANRTYRVSFQQEQLSLQIDSLQRFELIPVSDDTLYAGEGHIIKFVPTVTGSIDRLDLYDNGRHIVAHRR